MPCTTSTGPPSSSSRSAFGKSDVRFSNIPSSATSIPTSAMVQAWRERLDSKCFGDSRLPFCAVLLRSLLREDLPVARERTDELFVAPRLLLGEGPGALPVIQRRLSPLVECSSSAPQTLRSVLN